MLIVRDSPHVRGQTISQSIWIADTTVLRTMTFNGLSQLHGDVWEHVVLSGGLKTGDYLFNLRWG